VIAKRFKTLALIIGLPVAGVFLAWVSSADPKYNRASFETEPLVQRIADLNEAITLA